MTTTVQQDLQLQVPDRNLLATMMDFELSETERDTSNITITKVSKTKSIEKTERL